MKKILSILLVLTMLLSMAGCSLFADDSKLVLTDSFTHQDPKDLEYDERTVLKGTGFAEIFEQYVNAAAYPDTMVTDDSGNIIGMYIYDEETGLATGWTSFADGSTTMYPEGEEIDLGKPDTSLMIDIPGSVDMAAVVYGQGSETVAAYFYLFLSDAAAKDAVVSCAAESMGLAFSEEAEGVLKSTKNAEDIRSEFAMQESFGYVFETKNAQAYADYLKNYYGLRVENSANPYAPYDGHTDPEGLEYDAKTVLTGAGTYAVPENVAEHLTCMTDYVYEKDGTVAAHYIYFVFDSAESAQTAAETQFTFNQVTVSDTVIMGSLAGEEMQTVLNQYIGYNMLKDTSFAAYVEYLQQAYESSIYE